MKKEKIKVKEIIINILYNPIIFVIKIE